MSKIRIVGRLDNMSALARELGMSRSAFENKRRQLGFNVFKDSEIKKAVKIKLEDFEYTFKLEESTGELRKTWNKLQELINKQFK